MTIKKEEEMARYSFPILVEKDEDGFFVASTPVIQGCYTQGKTHKEVLERIQEAIEFHMEARQIKIDFLPQKVLRT